MDHLAHLTATVCTFGLWSVGWLAKTLHHARKPWRCTHCGSRLQPVPPAARALPPVGQPAAELVTSDV